MAKGRRLFANGRSNGEGQYLIIYYSFLHSPAWRSLSGTAAKVFLELHSRFDGKNNGKLCLSYQDASDILKLGKATVHRAFAELQSKGFIQLMRRGQWYGRKANEWRLTTKGYQGNHPTNEWMNWRPPITQNLEIGSQMNPLVT